MKDIEPQSERPVVLKRRDFRPRWNSPRADTPGYARAIIDGLKGVNFAANILVLPFGHGSPKHDFGGEVVVVSLTGEVEFRVQEREGEQRYLLEPPDLLYLPPGVTYEYRNVGMEQATFLSIAGRVDEWPARARYEGVEGEVTVHR